MKIIVFLFFSIILFSCNEGPDRATASILKNIKLGGFVFGTKYQVTYNSNVNYKKQFDSIFYVINRSLSTYQSNSDISKLNRNETNTVDEHFKHVFIASKDIYKKTEGAFDPTIGNVVNAWNFGAEKNKFLTDGKTIDSLMQFVGLDKITLLNYKISKPKTSYLEFNAIAKGYAVDVIADFLEAKKVKNFIVNIGGELNAKGLNLETEKGWTVGIENPNFDGTQSTNKIIILKDEAMATSGTYRKFKIDDKGNRYAHIIDAKTGYPSKTNLLSISVMAKNCITADAYATAFKSMGIKKVIAFLKEHPELKVFLIYENDNKELESLALNGFPRALKNIK